MFKVLQLCTGYKLYHILCILLQLALFTRHGGFSQASMLVPKGLTS